MVASGKSVDRCNSIRHKVAENLDGYGENKNASLKIFQSGSDNDGLYHNISKF